MKKNQGNKLLSGRLWLTTVAGISFLIFSFTVCHIMWVKREAMTGSELSSLFNVLLLIISNITTFYFTKNRDDTKTENKEVIIEDKPVIEESTKEV